MNIEKQQVWLRKMNKGEKKTLNSRRVILQLNDH